MELIYLHYFSSNVNSLEKSGKFFEKWLLSGFL